LRIWSNAWLWISLGLAAAVAAVAGIWLVTARRSEDPTTPAPRSKDYPWMSRASWWQRHEQTLRAQGRAQAELVFLGDSIFEGWDAEVYQERYTPYHALNLGIGGDQTQHVLYRIHHGALSGLRPKVVVLLIGTNNLGLENAAADSVAAGIKGIVDETLTRLPKSKILLLGILPRDQHPDSPARAELARINARIAQLDNGGRVRFLDVGSRFLDPDGTIPARLMEDYLHPTPAGYRVLAEAIAPLLSQMLDPGGKRPPKP
jgi:lysophospholipase L1-like esterase